MLFSVKGYNAGMPSSHFVQLAPTGRVAVIKSGPSAGDEAAIDATLIPFHLLNRGDEKGLCLANLRDRIDSGDSIALATMECIST